MGRLAPPLERLFAGRARGDPGGFHSTKKYGQQTHKRHPRVGGRGGPRCDGQRSSLIVEYGQLTALRRSLPVRALFTTTLFLSAALLFLVQPMVARMVLPLLGGTP